MARDIVIWPHKVLTTSTQPVTDFGPALQKLLEEMAASMAEAKGIGIAANQVGESLRVALVGREDGTSFEIVNPQILSKQGDIKLEEGRKLTGSMVPPRASSSTMIWVSTWWVMSSPVLASTTSKSRPSRIMTARRSSVM